MPSALPRAAVSQARRERLLRRSALAVTVLTAAIAVLAAAVGRDAGDDLISRRCERGSAPIVVGLAGEAGA